MHTYIQTYINKCKRACFSIDASPGQSRWKSHYTWERETHQLCFFVIYLGLHADVQLLHTGGQLGHNLKMTGEDQNSSTKRQIEIHPANTRGVGGKREQRRGIRVDINVTK